MVTGLPARKRTRRSPRGSSGVLFRFLYSHLGYRVDDPAEIRFAHRVHVGIWGRIHEVDRVRHAVLHGELHCVQVIAQRTAQCQASLLHPLQQLAS